MNNSIKKMEAVTRMEDFVFIQNKKELVKVGKPLEIAMVPSCKLVD